MPRPGVILQQLASPPPAQVPVSTGTWFVIGQTTSGTTGVPTLIQSFAQFTAAFGARGANPLLSDAVEAFFKEGGYQCYVISIGSAALTTAAASLPLFSIGLGPGQVSIPGATDTASQSALFTHAAAYNRIALVDLPDIAFGLGSQSASSTPAATTTIATAASLQTTVGGNAAYGAVFTPWLDIPPVSGSSTVRPVPPSAFVAAACAAVDALGNPNLPAAGINGLLTVPADLHAYFADSDRANLNSANVNVIAQIWGQTKIYGFRTLASQTSFPVNWQLNNARLDMAIYAKAALIAENYVFAQIDGQGQVAARLASDLIALLDGYYKQGALFGATAQQAYAVDTGPDLDTPTSEAGGNLIGQIAYRRSPEAEAVTVDLTPILITQAV